MVVFGSISKPKCATKQGSQLEPFLLKYFVNVIFSQLKKLALFFKNKIDGTTKWSSLNAVFSIPSVSSVESSGHFIFLSEELFVLLVHLARTLKSPE